MAALAIAPLAAGIAGATGHKGSTESVIVESVDGAIGSVTHAITALGGTVDRHLGLIGAVSAHVPSGAVPTLAHAKGVKAVVPDGKVRLESLPADYSASGDVNSLYSITQETGAQDMWAAGYTGAGVGVALIDSGVAPVEGLDQNVTYGPDLSFDSQSDSLAYYDSFGHGTHMAGIIAGRDSSANSANYVGDTSDFLGMAPDSHIVSVKVANSYGDVDVSQIIAGIDWAVSHRNDPGLNIRVINLSVGTESTQSYKLDPLAYAAEAAWNAGIVVVAAAGNDGSVLGQPKPKKGQSYASGYNGLTDPAYDPNILAVGAADTQGTLTPTDDTVASFSNTQGNGASADRKPDLVAPGVHVASLRDPGSFIDSTYGDSGGVDARLMRGSGTSQATAVVSGAAALVLSAHPNWKPDEVKSALMGSALKLEHTGAAFQGSGELSLTNLASGKGPKGPGPGGPGGNGNGSGSLDASRGGNDLVDPTNGQALTGETDIFGQTVDTKALAKAEDKGQAWSGGTFNGVVWTGTGFDSTGKWARAVWSGQDWAGVDFATSLGVTSDGLSGHTWSGHTWSGHTWSGHTWSGHTWSGHTWSSDGWS